MAKGVPAKGGVTKVIYKPDSQSTDEFIAYVHLEEVHLLSLRRDIVADRGWVM
jgi:hypothetical protein